MDYRRRNLLLHLVHKALFMLSLDRVAYLSRLTARTPGRLADNFAPRISWPRSQPRSSTVNGSKRPRRRWRRSSNHSAC